MIITSSAYMSKCTSQNIIKIVIFGQLFFYTLMISILIYKYYFCDSGITAVNCMITLEIMLT